MTAARFAPHHARVLLPVLALLACAAPAAAQSALPKLVGSVAPNSVLIGCDQASQPLTVTASSHLDPSCTYTAGVDVEASNVVLDCRGARIQSLVPNGQGIHIRSPADIALSKVTVRNCIVSGFQNGIRITRQGFKDLVFGQEYLHAFSDILIENTEVENTRASAVFVDGYVTDVTLREMEISGAGSVGVYLEAGSKDNVVTRCDIHDNGFGNVSPEGVPIFVSGVEFRYHSTGREGIAIDGSRNNTIVRNRIAGNSAGGIFLYKNCGEDFTSQPNGWWQRFYGADGNRIIRNEISDTPNGVWIGSRMAENQFFMDCSDPFYAGTGIVRIHEDFAKDNLVRRNTFTNVTYAIRIEDDDSRILSNRIASSDPAHQAVIVGTLQRTTVLDRPVLDASIRGNRAEIAGNAQPFSWIHGHQGTVFRGNRSNGVTVPALVPGVQPTINPFLFAIDVFLAP